MATPQITTRVDLDRQLAWAEVAKAHGYNRSELIIALMDGAVAGVVAIPRKPPTGECLFGTDPNQCGEPHADFPWSELCRTCKYRFRG